jgi:hypothetical protein
MINEQSEIKIGGFLLSQQKRQPYAALTCVHCQKPARLEFGVWRFLGVWILELGI